MLSSFPTSCLPRFKRYLIVIHINTLGSSGKFLTSAGRRNAECGWLRCGNLKESSATTRQNDKTNKVPIQQNVNKVDPAKDHQLTPGSQLMITILDRVNSRNRKDYFLLFWEVKWQDQRTVAEHIITKQTILLWTETSGYSKGAARKHCNK